MQTPAAEQVRTEVLIESLTDLWDVEYGLRPTDQARRIVVPNALVDDDAMLLALSPELIRRLGLERTGSTCLTRRGVRSALYDPVRLTIMGRTCTTDVVEAPDGGPARVGRLPLLGLDLVVDPNAGTLTGNPPHGGEQVYEMY